MMESAGLFFVLLTLDASQLNRGVAMRSLSLARMCVLTAIWSRARAVFLGSASENRCADATVCCLRVLDQ